MNEEYEHVMQIQYFSRSRVGTFEDKQSPLLETPIPRGKQPRCMRLPIGPFACCLTIAAIVSVNPQRAKAADLPENIEIKDATTIATVHAEGVQIYECKTGSDNKMSWQFREPLATLLQDGTTIGRHFAGPGWEFADGSTIKGKVGSQAPGATQNDIALLRLDVVEHRGDGVLSKVTAVQRLDTKGGVYSGPCDQPGTMHLEPYTARYVFLSN
ncbi:DUF3455 domain-containing protein [Agrobacterium sp. SHOUNA12C]|nr:DUF3455 domain-containing protein [Agrobacterium sp. BETTINA12B]MCJ9755071.1 DUF3455 domain-containing protein [Agrobacterium sp. SHOUNA12C]